MHSVLYPRELPVCHYKTALSRLQVYRPMPMAGNFCRRAGVQITRLPAAAYGRIILPQRCMHTRAATWKLPGCSGRFSNCSHCNAVAGYQTACTNAQCYPAAVAGYQTACTNAHCCPDAVAGYQTACARGCPAAVAVSQTA
jgi:hypothetical protein